MTGRKTAKCPKCGEAKTIPIVYGMPGPELFEAAERGEVVLGGCVLGDENPVWQCKACGAHWGRLSDSQRK